MIFSDHRWSGSWQRFSAKRGNFSIADFLGGCGAAAEDGLGAAWCTHTALPPTSGCPFSGLPAQSDDSSGSHHTSYPRGWGPVAQAAQRGPGSSGQRSNKRASGGGHFPGLLLQKTTTRRKLEDDDSKRSCPLEKPASNEQRPGILRCAERPWWALPVALRSKEGAGEGGAGCQASAAGTRAVPGPGS